MMVGPTSQQAAPGATANYMVIVEAGMRGRTRENLGELYARLAPHAHRIAFLLLGDQDRASDVVQDAFVRLFGHFRDIRHPEAFESYLRRTVVNLCRDQHRRMTKERARDQRLMSLRQQEFETIPVMPSASLIQTLRGLPHRQKVALVLRFFEDLSVEETAAVMGCSASSVKSLVNRGLGELRADLQKLEE